MTAEQKAAFINAQTAMMQAETQVMLSENEERGRRGLAMANGPEQWEAHIKKWENTLGYNAVLGFFQP